MLSTLIGILAVLGMAAVGMAITQQENRISATHLLHHYVAAPAATTLTTLGHWLDMQNYKCFMASYLKVTGTGNLTAFKIVANTASDGSGTTIVVNTDAFPVLTPDAAGNQIFLECTAQWLAALSAQNGVNLRYVSVQYQQATSGDTGVITYLATDPTFAYPGLTADAAS